MTYSAQIKAVEQFLQLRAADRHRVAADLARQDEPIAALKALAAQTQSVALPIHDLDPIAALIAKDIQRGFEDISFQSLLNEQCQRRRLFAHIDRGHAHELSDLSIRSHHA